LYLVRPFSWGAAQEFNSLSVSTSSFLIRGKGLQEISFRLFGIKRANIFQYFIVIRASTLLNTAYLNFEVLAAFVFRPKYNVFFLKYLSK